MDIRVIPGFLRAFGGGLLAVAYPPRCLGCQAPLAATASPLCARCLGRLEQAQHDEVTRVLASLPEAPDALDDAFVLWLFDKGGSLQRVQHALKYGNRPRYGWALGQLVGRRYRQAGHPRPDRLVPIPLHRTRYIDRGYNQSTALARGAAKVLKAAVSEDMLIRHRPTRSQTTLARRQRWHNVRGSFGVPDPAAVQGRHLLLFDDVLTTGATAAAAAQALKTAGAASVRIAALALARH